MSEARFADTVLIKKKEPYCYEANPKQSNFADDKFTLIGAVNSLHGAVPFEDFSEVYSAMGIVPVVGWAETFEPYRPHSLSRKKAHATVYTYQQAPVNFEIKIGTELICALGPQFGSLYSEIEKSKYILELEDDFDEEGSEGYKKETWSRAIRFLCKLFEFAFEKEIIELPSPKIYHGPYGSIDIFWKTDKFNLLLNVPKNEEQLGTFSGESANGEKVKGDFDPSLINYGIVFLFSIVK